MSTAQSNAPTPAQFKIDMTKVDPALVDKALKKLGLPKTGDFEERVQRLLEHQVQNTKPDGLVVCLADDGGCGGPSDLSEFDSCPYCGMSDEPALATAATSGIAPSAVKPATPADPPAKEPRVKKATAKAKLVNSSRGDAFLFTESLDKGVEAHSAEVVAPGDVSEAALDAAVSRVTAAKSAGATCFWDLGAAIRDIYDRRLYTQRKDENGKPVYASWEAFVRAEIGMSKTHVFNAMDVSKAFSREDFQLIGVSKLALIAKLDPDAQADLLERTRKGLPKAQVSDEVRRLAGMGHARKEGSTGRKDPLGSKRGAGNSANKKAPPRLEADQLTAIVTRERISVPLFVRAKPNAKPDARDKLPRAMKVAQDPHGSHELPNGVVMHVRLVLEAKGLAIKVEFRPPVVPAK